MLSRRGFIQTGLLAGALTLAGCKRTVPAAKVSESQTPTVVTPPERPNAQESARQAPLIHEEYAQRLAAAQRLLTQAKISCLFLTPGTNFYYLSGMPLHRSERLMALLVPDRGDPVVICPSFEEERVHRASPMAAIKTWEEDEDPFQAVRDALLHMKVASRSIGIEPTTEFETYLQLRRIVPGASLVTGTTVLDRLRMIKSPREQEFLRKAVEGTLRAIDRVLPTLTSDVSERQAAQDIRSEMRRQGGDGGGIVQFGPDSALPHGEPTERKLGRGEVVLFDVGMRVQGYTSDITRTSLYKDRNPEVEKIFDVVLQAQRAGQSAAHPGVSCEAVDAAARRVIEEAGYDKYFTHRLGHGVGLDGHEKPYLVHGNRTLLQPGMTITIEPGIYLPGKFGVRIEDDFVITEDGCKPLSTLETSLRLI